MGAVFIPLWIDKIMADNEPAQLLTPHVLSGDTRQVLVGIEVIQGVIREAINPPVLAITPGTDIKVR